MVQLQKNRRVPTTPANQARDDFGREGSRGFITVGLLALIPLLLAVFLTAGRLSLLLREHTHAHSVCEKRLFEAQDVLAKNLNALLKLNPQALELRLERKTTEFELRLAKMEQNHGAVLMLTLRLIKIKNQQAALGQEQKALLNNSRNESSRQKSNLDRALREYKVRTKIPPLQVRPDLPREIAPVYQPVINFSRAQIARAQYEWREHRFRCAVTIEPRGSAYRAALTEVL